MGCCEHFASRNQLALIVVNTANVGSVPGHDRVRVQPL